MNVEVAMLDRRTMRRPTKIQFPLHRKVVDRAVATKNPPMVPLMKTSPWAKLMNRRTP